MNTTLAQLRHLIALAESRSFTLGAEQSNRSQAAFSRSIAVLEANLGITLVDRSGHRNALTPVGQTVLEHARQVVADADELHQFAKYHRGGDAGHVRIGLGPTPNALLMGPLLTYASRHPAGMRMELSRGPIPEQVQALRHRRLDALVVDPRSVPPDSDLHVEQVATLATGFLCRNGHPLAHSRALGVKQLVRYPIASTGMSEEMARLIVKAFGPALHASSLIALRSEDVPGLLECVRGSDALFMGVLAPATDWVARGELVRLPFATKGLDTKIAWVRRNGRALNPGLAGVRALVGEVLGGYANSAKAW